jgi:hypothetical protein
MTKEKLLAIMESAGLTRDDLSAITGRTSRQTYAWTTGEAPVPRALALVLYGLEDQTIGLMWLAGAIRKERQ